MPASVDRTITSSAALEPGIVEDNLLLSAVAGRKIHFDRDRPEPRVFRLAADAGDKRKESRERDVASQLAIAILAPPRTSARCEGSSRCGCAVDASKTERASDFARQYRNSARRRLNAIDRESIRAQFDRGAAAKRQDGLDVVARERHQKRALVRAAVCASWRRSAVRATMTTAFSGRRLLPPVDESLDVQQPADDFVILHALGVVYRHARRELRACRLSASSRPSTRIDVSRRPTPADQPGASPFSRIGARATLQAGGGRSKVTMCVGNIHRAGDR